MWWFRLRTFITSLLKDECGLNAVQFALIMTLVAVVFTAAVIVMAS